MMKSWLACILLVGLVVGRSIDVVNQASELAVELPAELKPHQQAPSAAEMKPIEVSAVPAMPVVADPSSSDVVLLTTATFDQFISKDSWLLQFYSPWRGNVYSKFEPIYEEVAVALKGSVKVGKVDCTVERVICSKHEYGGILYIKNNEIRQYTSEWTLDGLKKFAESGWESVPASPFPWTVHTEKPEFVEMPGHPENGLHDLVSSKPDAENGAGDKDKIIAELVDIILKFNPSALPAHLQPTATASNEKVTKFHDAVVSFGLPSKENIHFYPSYVASSNYQKRIPNWGIQYLNEENSAKKNANRDKSIFTGDLSHIPPEFRVSTNDYTGSGWTRGHMIPATDLRSSQEEMDTTFHLNDNIVPQNAGNNMGVWKDLEDFARGKMVKQFRDVYVVSGPAFLPPYNPVQSQADLADKKKSKTFVQYELIGNNDVAVPTHLFKVFLVPDGIATPQTYFMGAFLVPNEDIKKAELKSFELPVAHLEKYTGLKFFQNLNRTTQIKPLCDSTSVCKFK